jgi:antitoxin ParD1/3/4
MQISLNGQFEEMVNNKIASGLYQDAGEVVRESLRFMQMHEEWIYQIKLEQLKSQLQIGINQLDEGDSVSGRDFFLTLNQDWDDV